MTEWLREHPFITFVLLYISLAFVYVKVFRQKRLPVLKELIIFAAIGIGALILWLFQLDLRMPVAQCMLAALSLMLIVRVRIMYLERIESRKRARQELS
jgi:hypothetical protein